MIVKGQVAGVRWLDKAKLSLGAADRRYKRRSSVKTRKLWALFLLRFDGCYLDIDVERIFERE
jgi:hypothetical protein